jgi:hypothetical protein
MTDLLREPSERLWQQQQPEPRRYRVKPYQYRTADDRWHVIEHRGCGGGWMVVDTHGRIVCMSCTDERPHAAVVSTLFAARAFIGEWTA